MINMHVAGQVKKELGIIYLLVNLTSCAVHSQVPPVAWKHLCEVLLLTIAQWKFAIVSLQ